MTDSRILHKGACHCGAVQFKVKLTDELNTARRCTCSMCSRRGAQFAGFILIINGVLTPRNLVLIYLVWKAKRLSLMRFPYWTVKTTPVTNEMALEKMAPIKDLRSVF